MSDIIGILSSLYPDVKIQLYHSNPFELLIATILSAQCTDARVNIVTQALFVKYKLPQDYLNVEIEELEQDIFSTGFYKAKAKNIREACRMIIDEFDGNVPDNLDDLLKLPGVGRKTANVILGHCFETPAIVVDTHVIRISNKLGFVESSDAVKIEFSLMKLISKELWVTFTHYFINHGRNTCIARRPKCTVCAISHLCPSSND
jgi:endonuclease-3